jgi:PhnB protein
MTNVSIYLLLDGTCQPAMEFYQSVFGGNLTMTQVSDTPASDHLPAHLQQRIIHARLQGANVDISASDWLRPEEIPVQGNKTCLYISGNSYEEVKSLYDKLSVGANITDPLKQEFFGAYGALNDKFGNRWMFHTANI